MITIDIKKHDDFHIESKMSYPVDAGAKSQEYSIETYFFMPTNLKINSTSYPKHKFYEDIHGYIRLKTPSITIADLATKKSMGFSLLKEAVTDTTSTQEYTENIKMFCSIAKSSFREGGCEIEATAPEEFVVQLTAYTENCTKVLKRFRSIKKRCTELGRDKGFYQLADEFLSISLTRQCGTLFRNLKTRVEDEVILSKAESILATVMRRELAYRRKSKYSSVPTKNRRNSNLTYREGALKKLMGSILFFDISTQRDGIWLDNLFLSAAAALAMAFVTAIAFMWNKFFVNQFSIAFFIVWVLAYILKDRMKALLQNFFVANRYIYTYDHKKTLNNSSGESVGFCREGVRYIKESQIDENILKLCRKAELAFFERKFVDEKVLLFRKKIKIKVPPKDTFFNKFKADGVVDIVRYNVERWLSNLDDPYRTILYPSARHKLEELKCYRDYHINMVVKIEADSDKSQVNYHNYLVIIAKDGIKEIREFIINKKDTL